MTERKQHRLRSIFCAFLILPVTHPFLAANNLTPDWPLQLVVILTCVSSFLFVRKWLRIPFYLFGTFWCLYTYYPLQRSFSVAWITTFWQTMLGELSQLFAGELTYIPESFSLVLILILLIILTILVIDYRWWSFAYLLIMFYFMSLAVFKEYELVQAMMVTTIAAALFPLSKLYESQAKAVFWNYVINGVLLFGVALGIGYLFPRFAPETMDKIEAVSQPVRSFFNDKGLYAQINHYGLGGASSRTGFSENDQQLGGPLVDNNDVLFTAVQNQSHYWKVENKSNYTGKGWISLEDSSVEAIEETPYSLMPFATQLVGNQRDTVELTLHADQTYLPYPYGNIEVTSMPLTTDNSFYFLENNQRFVLSKEEAGSFTTLIATNYLTYTPEELASVELSETDKENLSAYLQLPDSLPNRVGALAQELTQDEDSLYDKVLAIQNYLKRSGTFRYSKTDTPHTPDGRDYVDYFLFDSQVGYCDNFSSSMVVLLRSIGIPARWTKGFTAGQETASSGARKTFTVLNSDAHSWPEVYFAGYGWLPFEPTTTFSSPVTSHSEQTTTANTLDVSANNDEQTATTTTSTTEEATTNQATDGSSRWQLSPDMIKNLSIVLGLFLVVGLSILFLRRHDTWILFLVYLRFSNQFTHIYQSFLHHCERLIPRDDSESLATYSQRFSHALTLDKRFTELTARYEQELYGRQEAPWTKDEFKQLMKEIKQKQRAYKKLQKLKFK
ncbi:MAG: DUF4129 domain-containing transglutaminase family protein [Enterococcus sp.]